VDISTELEGDIQERRKRINDQSQDAKTPQFREKEKGEKPDTVL